MHDVSARAALTLPRPSPGNVGYQTSSHLPVVHSDLPCTEGARQVHSSPELTYTRSQGEQQGQNVVSLSFVVDSDKTPRLCGCVAAVV